MKNKTFIVLLEVDYDFGRDIRPTAEMIENHNFKGELSHQIRDEIIELLELDEIDGEHISVFPITDFMDAFNDEEIVECNYFMSYVNGYTK